MGRFCACATSTPSSTPGTRRANEFALVELEPGKRAKFQGNEEGGVVVTLVYRVVENGLEVDFDKTGSKPERVTFRFKKN